MGHNEPTLKLSSDRQNVARKYIKNIKDSYSNRQFSQCLQHCKNLLLEFSSQIDGVMASETSSEDQDALRDTSQITLLDVLQNGKTFYGLCLVALEDHTSAQKEFQELLLIARKFQHPKTELYALGNLAMILTLQGKPELALEYNERMMELCRQQNWTNELAQSLGSSGVSQYKLGDYNKANNYFQEMLAVSKDKIVEFEVMANNYLGLVLIKQDQLPAAKERFLEAYGKINQIIDYQTRRDLLGNLGEISVKLNELDSSIQYFKEQLEEAQRFKDVSTVSLAQMNRGLVFLMLKSFTQSVEELLDSATVSELSIEAKYPTIRVEDFVNVNKLTEQVIHCHTYTSMAYIKQSEALEDESQKRAAQVKALCAAEMARNSTCLARYLEAKWNPLKNKYATNLLSMVQLATRTQQTIVVYEYMNESLHAKWHAYSEQQYVYAFVITPAQHDLVLSFEDNFFFKKIKVEENLQEFLQQLVTTKDMNDVEVHQHDAIAARKFNSNMQKLYSWLIAPIEEHIPLNGKMLFMPHHVLYLVPFSCLIDAREDYLISKCEVSIVPSFRMYELLEMQYAHTAKNNQKRYTETEQNPWLIVGNPSIVNNQSSTEDKPPLPPMKHAAEEAKTLGKLIGQEPLTDDKADKQTVLDRLNMEPTAIHFATHFSFHERLYENVDMSGAFVLTTAASTSASKKEDYYLYATEIESLSLNHTMLAVLSACETMKGTFTVSGIAGLYRAFFIAGVPCVVQSLWPLHDVNTKKFVDQFYLYLINEEMTVSKALRMAMLKQIESNVLPHYWGAFISTGFCELELGMSTLQENAITKKLSAIEATNIVALNNLWQKSRKASVWKPYRCHLLVPQSFITANTPLMISLIRNYGFFIHNSIDSLLSNVVDADMIVVLFGSENFVSIVEKLESRVTECLVIGCAGPLHKAVICKQNYCAYFGIEKSKTEIENELMEDDTSTEVTAMCWRILLQQFDVSISRHSLFCLELFFKYELRMKYSSFKIQVKYHCKEHTAYDLKPTVKNIQTVFLKDILLPEFDKLSLAGNVMKHHTSLSSIDLHKSKMASPSLTTATTTTPTPIVPKLSREERSKLKMSDPINLSYKPRRRLDKVLLDNFVNFITKERIPQFISTPNPTQSDSRNQRLEMNQDFLTSIYMHDSEMNEMVEQFPDETTHSFSLVLQLDAVDPYANRFKIRMENQQPDNADMYLCMFFVNLNRKTCSCIYPTAKKPLTSAEDFRVIHSKQYVELQIQLNARHIGTMQYVIFAATNVNNIQTFLDTMYNQSKEANIVDILTSKSSQLGVAMHIHQFEVTTK